MYDAVVIAALVLVINVALAFFAVVLGIHLEDGRGSLADEPSGLITAGTRSVLRVFSTSDVAARPPDNGALRDKD
ncbi:hypothetical protein [Microbispora sp. ATCC PTA-5024]|uniref:hypothetical protein n=1 Tax=Microbispora sp. ATCC PTA-5024 TaxID=316330 RepID=UPI0004076D7C|nr:hypothetical protein [Microbispora sp. ATCC PTA-5024]